MSSVVTLAVRIAGIVSMALVPGLASAQQIGGTVTDSMGAVLPGVTVEARSPALIEQVRTVVTDGTGQYLIVALVPGTYRVTFTLTGFTTIVREGIQLSTGFTANVDAQLPVGSVEETITVTGASPIVDVQNVAQRQVMNRDIIDSMPTGKSITSYGLLIPGMVGREHRGSSLSQDSGGMSTQIRMRMAIHGGNHEDQQLELGGLDVGDPFSQGDSLAFFPDTNMQEMAFQYSGNAAEVETGGVRINMIPKEGGNRFGGSFFTTFAVPALQANNLNDTLIQGGIEDPNTIDQVWSVNPNFGGPIVQDRLWFFLTHTTQRAYIYPSGSYWAVDPRALTFVPNKNDRVLDSTRAREQSLNLTLQATSKDKFRLYWSNSSTDWDVGLFGTRGGGTTFVAGEASAQQAIRPNVYQAAWVRPHTSRLLFEAGFSHQPIGWANHPVERALPVITLPGVRQVSPNFNHRNISVSYSGATHRWSPKSVQSMTASASYVTGSHNLKFGMTGLWQWTGQTQTSDNNWTNITVLGNTPITATFFATQVQTDEAWTLGLYAQDQWRIGRATINAGLRFDNTKAGYPDQVRPASIWAPQEFATEGRTVVDWKDLQPRLGLAYDLTGDGKTALKVSASRYGKRDSTDRSEQVNPAVANRTMNRTWNDRTCVSGPCIPGDGIPQGDPRNPAPNGELLSPNSNLAFGAPAITVFYDDNWAFGWGKRESNWEFSGNVQRQLLPGLSIDFGYFHRRYANLSAVDNRAVGPEDYDRFTVLIPNDSRLRSDLRGQPITLLDLKPTSNRPSDTITTSANNFGGRTRSWNGFDFTSMGRLRGLLLQGGISSGSLSTDSCGMLALLPEMQGPVPLEHCKTSETWQTAVKMMASYTLPYAIQVAGTIQDQPGLERSARVTFTAAEISAALGRPAVGTAQTVAVSPPGTEFGERFSEVDLRLSRLFTFGRNVRFKAMFDIFNLFNSNAVTSEELGFGPTYLAAKTITPGRFGKFAFQIDF